MYIAGKALVASSGALFIDDSNANVAIYMHDAASFVSSGDGQPPVIGSSGSGFVVIYAHDEAVITVPTISFASSSNGVIVASDPGVSVASGLYPYLQIGYPNPQGMFVDATSGTGHTSIPASTNTDALLFSAGMIWQSNGTSWEPITNTTLLILEPSGALIGTNVYTTFADLAAASVMYCDGPYTVFFDLSNVSGTYTIPGNGGSPYTIAPYGTWTDMGFGYSLVWETPSPALSPGPPPNLAGSIIINLTGALAYVNTWTGAPVTVTMTDRAQVMQSTSSSGGWITSNQLVTVEMSQSAKLVNFGGNTNPVVNFCFAALYDQTQLRRT